MKKAWGVIKKPFVAMRTKWRGYVAKRPHRSFRKTKPPLTMPELATLPSNTVGTFKTIWKERRLLGVLVVVYMAVTYVFVGGIAQTDFVDLKNATLDVFGGKFNSAGTAFSLLTSTMSGAFSGNMNELQQFLAVLIGIVFWLTLVWALRMRFADKAIKARDAMYNAGTPLVSYAVLLSFIVLQLAPGAIGVAVFTAGQAGSYFQGGVEVMSFAAAAFLLVCLSIYWLSGSLVSLVIVTLPQMYPWRALQIAGELAHYRRVRLLQHTLWLVISLFVIWAAVLLPALLLDAWLHFDWLPLIPLIVQLLGALTLVYASTYVYRLYRSML